MSIKLGTRNIVGAKLGSHNICKIYKGSTLYMDFCGGGDEDEYPPYSILYSSNSSGLTTTFNINGNSTGIKTQPNMTDELVTFDVGSGLTSLRQFCYGPSNLTSLKFVGKWDTSKVTDFYYFVSYNSSLETLEGIENFVISSATNMSNCIYSNTKLKEVDISGWVLNENISYYNMPVIQADKIYCSCDFKTALFNKTVANANSNSTYFQNMITTPSECPLTELENAIYYKTNSTSNSNYFRLDGSNTLLRPTSETSGSYYIFGKKDFTSGYTKGLYNFATNIKNLTYIEFMPTWKTENVTSAYNMFYGCSALEEVKGLENIDWSNVIYLDSIFSYCENLKNIDFSILSSCNEIINASMAFNSCKKITEADISDFNFSETATLTYMFSNCTALETVNLGELTPSSRKFDSMFNNCNSLSKIICTCEMKRYIEFMSKQVGLTDAQMQNIKFETIDGDDCPEYIPNNAIRYSTTSITSSDYLYWNGNSTGYKFPTSKTDEIYIVSNTSPTSLQKMFYFNTNLTKLEFVGNWDTRNVTTTRQAFYYVNNITELDLSKWNTRKVTDMYQMFRMQSLDTLKLGKDFVFDNVNNYTGLFYDVPNLRKVYCCKDAYNWLQRNMYDIGLGEIWWNIKFEIIDLKELTVTFNNNQPISSDSNVYVSVTGYGGTTFRDCNSKVLTLDYNLINDGVRYYEFNISNFSDSIQNLTAELVGFDTECNVLGLNNADPLRTYFSIGDNNNLEQSTTVSIAINANNNIGTYVEDKDLGGSVKIWTEYTNLNNMYGEKQLTLYIGIGNKMKYTKEGYVGLKSITLKEGLGGMMM